MVAGWRAVAPVLGPAGGTLMRPTPRPYPQRPLCDGCRHLTNIPTKANCNDFRPLNPTLLAPTDLASGSQSLYTSVWASKSSSSSSQPSHPPSSMAAPAKLWGWAATAVVVGGLPSPSAGPGIRRRSGVSAPRGGRTVPAQLACAGPAVFSARPDWLGDDGGETPLVQPGLHQLGDGEFGRGRTPGVGVLGIAPAV